MNNNPIAYDNSFENELKLLYKSGLSGIEISQKLNVKKWKIYSTLKKLNITRSPKQYRKLCSTKISKAKRKFNEHALDKMNNDAAYGVNTEDSDWDLCGYFRLILFRWLYLCHYQK